MVAPLFRLIKITQFSHGSIALLFCWPIKSLHCSLFPWQYSPFISANQISQFFPWQYGPFILAKQISPLFSWQIAPLFVPITHFPEVSAHDFLSFPRIQFCTERRIQLCAVRKTLRKQLPVLRRLTQIYNMRIQVTMTCGGSPPGRVWEGTSHPGSLREWIPSRVPPGREGALRQRDFFSNRRHR
jgi:hypothetical protein